MFRFRVLFILAVLFHVLTTTACGPDSQSKEVHEAIREAIVGGKPDYGHPAVGALLMDNGLCTGTLIAPSVVLTAAHCVEDGFPKVFVQGTNALAPGEILTVADARIHPDYGTHVEQGIEVAWNDIALVRLSGASNVPPIGLADDDSVGIGHAVTFVGFGLTDPESSSFGRKYKMTTDIALVWKEGFWNVTNPDALHNTCYGDSGGPALIDEEGKEQVFGVVSSGDPDCKATGYSIRVDRNRAFIDGTLEDWAGEGAGPSETVEPASLSLMWEPCDKETRLCPSGRVCIGSSDGWRCTAPCLDPEGGLGCPEGYACVSLEKAASDGVCVPIASSCGDGLCGPGETDKNCASDCKDPCGGVGYAGCCDQETVYWCEDGELKHLSCKEDLYCGWNKMVRYYDCGMADQPGPDDESSACPGPSAGVGS